MTRWNPINFVLRFAFTCLFNSINSDNDNKKKKKKK